MKTYADSGFLLSDWVIRLRSSSRWSDASIFWFYILYCNPKVEIQNLIGNLLSFNYLITAFVFLIIFQMKNCRKKNKWRWANFYDAIRVAVFLMLCKSLELELHQGSFTTAWTSAKWAMRRYTDKSHNTFLAEDMTALSCSGWNATQWRIETNKTPQVDVTRLQLDSWIVDFWVVIHFSWELKNLKWKIVT